MMIGTEILTCEFLEVSSPASSTPPDMTDGALPVHTDDRVGHCCLSFGAVLGGITDLCTTRVCGDLHPSGDERPMGVVVELFMDVPALGGRWICKLFPDMGGASVVAPLSAIWKPREDCLFFGEVGDGFCPT